MESQLSNALLDVKLPYEFMKKEYFEFCEYYRKKWGKIKKFVIFSNLKNWVFDKWNVKREKLNRR